MSECVQCMRLIADSQSFMVKKVSRPHTQVVFTQAKCLTLSCMVIKNKTKLNNKNVAYVCVDVCMYVWCMCVYVRSSSEFSFVDN